MYTIVNNFVAPLIAFTMEYSVTGKEYDSYSELYHNISYCLIKIQRRRLCFPYSAENLNRLYAYIYFKIIQFLNRNTHNTCLSI